MINFGHKAAGNRVHRRFRRVVFMFVVCGIVLYWNWPALTRRYPRLRLWVDESCYDDIIRDAAGRHGVSPYLVKAVIRQESRFASYSVGKAGERGLMQVTMIAVKDWEAGTGGACPHPGLLFNPTFNIEIGTWYLARGLKRWREFRCSEALALAEYNAGLSRAQKWAPKDKDDDVLSLIGFPSTRQYIINILDYKNEFERQAIN